MAIQKTVQGTLSADGTLKLDDKVPIPAGRVLVTVQPVVQPAPDNPFWQNMERIWTNQEARRHVPRTAEEVKAQRHALANEMEQELDDAMRLQEECRQRRAVAANDNYHFPRTSYIMPY